MQPSAKASNFYNTGKDFSVCIHVRGNATFALLGFVLRANIQCQISRRLESPDSHNTETDRHHHKRDFEFDIQFPCGASWNFFALAD
jgi:hypothetical protein